MYCSTDPLFQQSKQLLSLVEITTALTGMAKSVASDYSSDDSKDKPLVISVMNGGLITTGHFLTALEISVDVDYCHATRYGNQTSGGELQWLSHPRQSLVDRHVLLVDDIFDEGVTLQLITHYCIAQGAKSVKSAVLLDKQHNRKVAGFRPNYVALTIPDYYVFGFGLDYKGSYRNAPGIFALKTIAE